ncbi:hypothetical protein EQG49_12435 [Periweissella cryptocerci]|uniref:Uncharacterized protein n=1 Tax=Periweissella cryptocerci TaxID=2506420 RepID=A0A4V1AIZ3_9LACO|nr:hypothetical protein [Periweissella cryptocerci]QBO37205.1 hypothetical protein EQG49_12435 [Periweissella cryptocerci]
MTKFTPKFSAVLMSLVIASSVALPEISANSDKYSVSWTTHMDGGIVKGDHNDQYHNFREGKHVSVTVSSCSGAGTAYVQLYRSKLFADLDLGTETINLSNPKTAKFSKKTDKTSGSYYFWFWGGNSKKVSLKGTMHD